MHIHTPFPAHSESPELAQQQNKARRTPLDTGLSAPEQVIHVWSTAHPAVSFNLGPGSNFIPFGYFAPSSNQLKAFLLLH